MQLLRRKALSKEQEQTTWLAVGLGNPSERFENTRHNAGARAIQRLAEDLSIRLKSGRSQAITGDGSHDGVRIVCARPTTWYNESGVAVASLLKKHRLGPSRMIVVHDDIDLRAHILRLKFGGGSAGNHGIESIERTLGTQEFYRVRIGVGRPTSSRIDPADFVLQPMTKKVAEEFAVTEAQAAEAVLALMHDGLERAMNRFNTR